MENSKNEKLVHRLLDINHRMRMLYEGKASQSRILILLQEQSIMTQKHLTELLGIQPGSVSEILSKLEKADLISRTQSEKDHRTMEISLTENGKKLAEEAIAQRQKRHEQMFVCLTEDEQDTLLLLLEKLEKDWDERFSLSRNPILHKKKNHRRDAG